MAPSELSRWLYRIEPGALYEVKWARGCGAMKKFCHTLAHTLEKAAHPALFFEKSEADFFFKIIVFL